MDKEDKNPPKPRRRWARLLFRSFGIFVLVLIGLLIWLNGPGLRWLGPKIAAHFLEKAEIHGGFRLEGSVTGGLSVADLKLESDGSLKKLTIERATPLYRFADLIHGKVIGLEAQGIDAQLRLGIEKEEEEKQPKTLEEIVQMIRDIRPQVIPLKVAVNRVSVSAEKEGQPVFALDPSDFTHDAGSSEFNLNLGKMVAAQAQGQELPPQQSALIWEQDRITLKKLDPYPGIGIRDLAFETPASGQPQASVQLLVNDSVFDLDTAPGFSAASLNLRSGSLQLDEVAKSFGVEIPAAAKLTSLSLNVDDVMPDPLAATGMLQIVLEGVQYQDWSAPEVTFGATLEAAQASASLRTETLGTPVNLDVRAPIQRDGLNFKLGNATGELSVPKIPELIAQLAQRFDAIKADAVVPPSSLAGKFTVAFDDNNKPASADATLDLTPENPVAATPLKVTARWQGDAPATATVEMTGLKLDGTYQIAEKRYSGNLTLTDFKNQPLEPWLAIAGVELPGDFDVSASWKGSGDLVAKTHQGELALAAANWVQPEKSPIDATGDITYEWPGKVEATGLTLKAENQTIVANAELADNLLTLKNLLWTDGETEMASGTASLPVPEDFSKWREMLANDQRPLEIAIESRELSLAELKPWLPAAAKLDARSTGYLKIYSNGSYSDPKFDLALDLVNLHSPDQKQIPPVNLRLSLKAGDGRMVLDGGATAPDYAPAVIKADMDFRPSEWANNPDLIKQEKVNAEVELPRWDISRFAALVPSAKKLAGIFTAKVTVSGTVGEPEILGNAKIENGNFELNSDAVPPITGLTLDADATLSSVNVKTLRATIAGGTISASGTLGLKDGLGPLDFRVTGDHLPALRNEMMIVRTNADLRLQGPWDSAELTGEVGLVDSLFYRDIELLPIGVPFTGPSAASLPKLDAPKNPTSSVPEPFSNWRINVTVVTKDPFLIRGNLGTGQVDVALRIGGTIGNLAPDGTVRIRRGVAVLPFSTLNIPEGIVRFTPATGFDPILEIKGTSNPRPYQVEVYVYGSASDPQLVLTSNPPLPENEIMTLLATGTTTSGLEDTDTASSRALQLLIEEARRGRLPFSKQLRPLLKLADRVDFNLAESDPYDSDSFSTATIKLTDRYYISAGMGEQGDTRLIGIWRLNFR
ncbi:translocation/assembly module TamB domain-containing protein [Luteolibacter pohnpeiensis]|uniref:Translocation/assembly module TamB domain-containing protein n=1 Tax=Luteolibacter pohnpeiensis TaxID=454153 RepID=A0A934VPS4_9BACT|nr:translocation/assembly module TamB domain-containing protein [Luteolibacter pohnpeiensis]MBK1881331.1 translocation/assembly module TamB domain-containing protein [Luteolibacter pohnpeiensis]